MAQSSDARPFEGYTVYGPYGRRRRMVALVSARHKTTMSYARYLVSVKLGRRLTADEEVDHIDDDCMNDAIGNLQILTPAENREKQNRLRLQKALVTLICPQCDRSFTRPRRYTNLRSGGSGAPSFCSRSCSVIHHNTKRGKLTVVDAP